MFSDFAIETLLRLAKVRQTMLDDAGAIDTYWATIRIAISSYIKVDTSVSIHKEALEQFIKESAHFPRFLVPAQVETLDNSLSQARYREIDIKLKEACGPDEQLRAWPAAEAAFALVLSYPDEVLGIQLTEGDTQRWLSIAMDALQRLITIIPPKLLEPCRPIGQHAEDKMLYIIPGRTNGPVQDVGWVYDRLPMISALASIAQIRLSSDKSAPYLVDYAEKLFERGQIDAAENIIRQVLQVAPSAENHNALLRYMLASSATDEVAFFQESRRWAALYANESELVNNHYTNNRDPERPLCIGYMCDFLGTTLAQHTLIPQFRTHDRSKVRVAYYSHGSEGENDKNVIDLYRNVKNLSSEELFDCIKKDEVDILVDLNGRLRVKNRYDLLCRKAAPIQVNWYNLMASTGLKSFDFIVTDNICLPPEKRELCTEEIMYLDCQVSGSWQLPAEPQVAPLPYFHKGVFVFGCFGAAFKVNQDVLHTWLRLMHAAPEAMLYLKNIEFYTVPFRNQIRDFFVENGISESRLRLENGSSFHKMRALYAHVDLCIDTFPYGNGSTTINALWQGVPTLALDTGEWRARTSVSIMKNAGLDDFIVTSVDEYIEKAIWFMQHPHDLAAVRASIRGRLKNSGYYNIEIFTCDLEAAYRKMWHAWLKRSQN